VQQVGRLQGRHLLARRLELRQLVELPVAPRSRGAAVVLRLGDGHHQPEDIIAEHAGNHREHR
jgi:hypothetical protein